MPDPDKLLNTIHKARDLTRQTPGRRGRLIHIPLGDEVLVAGDLHGHIGNLQRILKIADLAQNPRRHLVLQELIHGPFRYPDGSDKSHQAVDLWCALKCQYPSRVHFLPGNHELAQGTNRMIAKGTTDLNANFLDGVRTAYGRTAEQIYPAYLELFSVLPIAVRTATRVFLSHSLPTAAVLPTLDLGRLELQTEHTVEDLEPGGLVYSFVWGRDVAPAHVHAFLHRVDSDLLVTGHIPCERGFAIPNDHQVILDCLGAPACVLLIPGDITHTHAELVSRIQTI